MDWTKALKVLEGRRIVSARYQTAKEAERWGWSSRGVMLAAENGDGDPILVTVATDDEGNGPGALHTNLEDCPIFPALPLGGA